MTGLCKFHLDLYIFPLKFVHVKDILVQIHAHKVFEIVKLLLVTYPGVI